MQFALFSLRVRWKTIEVNIISRQATSQRQSWWMRIVIPITLSHFMNGAASTVKSQKEHSPCGLSSQSFQNGSPIPAEFAFGRIDPIHHCAFSRGVRGGWWRERQNEPSPAD